MIRVLGWLFFGWALLVVQTGVAPLILPAPLKPDLILVLSIYLGLRESPVRGGFTVLGLGCLADIFAGRYLGVNGLTLLLLFLLVRGMADRLNIESRLLLLVLVALGTLAAGTLTAFLFTFFTDHEGLTAIVLQRLPAQLILNLAAALVLLWALGRLQRKWGPKVGLPGFRHLEKSA